MIRRALVIAVPALLFVALAMGGRFAIEAVPSGTGLAAKHLCSLAYVSGLDRDFARRAYVDPFVQPLSRLLSVDYDDSRGRVTVRSAGLWRAQARVRRGLGCTLIHGTDGHAPVDLPRVHANPTALEVQHRRAAFDEAALEKALDDAFREPDEASLRNTMAVVVLHRGRLVAERYAHGADESTPLPGWSMTKSVVATLAGILVHQGRIDPAAPGAIGRWRGSDDPRAAITLDHLLRMNSGIDVVEDQTGADPNSEMLFQRSDAAAFAAARPLKAAPEEHWEYMSGSTVLATRAVQDAVGGSLEDVVGFMRRELFAPLGMSTAIMEPDEAGTPIGSSFMLASARDWALLGQLHLQDGAWNGRRILPVDWIGYITRRTAGSPRGGYGAGWWLNEEGGAWASLPHETYQAQGFQSQHVAVVPPHDLVVARLGATAGSRAHVEKLIADVIAALR